MATQNFSTTIRSNVPECELQAILYEMDNCACFSSDLIRLMQNHKDDGGELSINGIVSPSVDSLGDVAISIISKNMSLIGVLSKHIGVPNSATATTFTNILDNYHEDESKAVSAEYQAMLNEEEGSL